MATSKRERQRANRELRRAEEAAAARKAGMFQKAKRVAIWVVVLAVTFVLANLVFGGSDAEPAALVMHWFA